MDKGRSALQRERLPLLADVVELSRSSRVRYLKDYLGQRRCYLMGLCWRKKAALSEGSGVEVDDR